MAQIDVHKLTDHARFGGFHGLVLFWCALIIIFDGYDLAVAGIALPSIMKEMGVSPTNAGFMVSSALFGMMFGAIFLGTVADKIGRRWAIAICMLLFSVFTAAAGFTSDPVSFSITRFLAGLGIGGVMPNVVAQMTEYSPRKMRSTLVTLMFSGYSVGGMLAALLGKGLIESYGWQSVFVAAGLPVLLIPLILKSLPESMAFLIKHGRAEEVKRILPRIEPSYVPAASDEFMLPHAHHAHGAPIGKLFQDGRGFSTTMFWVAFFMCLFMVYALSSWLAKLMAGAGYSLGSALTFVLVLNFGAMIGAIGGGWPTASTSSMCWSASTRWPRCRSRCSATRSRPKCCTCWSAWPVPRPSARRSSPTRMSASTTRWRCAPPASAGRPALAAAARSWRRSSSAPWSAWPSRCSTTSWPSRSPP